MRDDTSAVAAMVEKAGLNVVGAQMKKYAKYNAFTVFIKVGMLSNQRDYQGILSTEDYIKAKLHKAGIDHGLITYGKFRHGANFIIRITQGRFC